MELQEDYRNYIVALRRVFDSQKAESQEVESTTLEEKKKPFVVINREKKYLRKSFHDYLKKNNLEGKFVAVKNYYSEGNSHSHGVNSNNKTKTSRKNNKRRNKLNRSRAIYRPVLVDENLKKDGTFMWPLKHNEFWISSFFGLRKVKKGYSFHYGIDLAAMKGTIIRAAASGTVIQASYSPGYGNTIVISHDKKYKTKYAHLNSILVKQGVEVEKGQKIGTVGDTGSVRSKGRDASHLHFEVFVYGKQVNPLYVLQ